MEQQAAVTEIERTACTMLQTVVGQIFEPKARAYVERILSEPDYAEYPNEYPNHADEAYGLAMDYLVHKAAVLLASGIARYRFSGRSTGDRTTDIGDGFTITSSLAANIVEFHLAIVNAYCVNADEQEDARS